MSRRGNGEGSIYRDGERWVGALYVRDHLGRTVKRKFSGKSRKDVAARLAATKQIADRQLPVGDPKLTTGAFLDQWLNETAAPSLRPRSFESYEMIVRLHLKPVLGAIPLVKLSPPQVQAYMAGKRAQGLSARTVQYHHSVLRRALHIAESWGAVPRNVARLVTPPRVQHVEVSPWTPEQARAFLLAIEGDRLSALYTVALAMGLRQGEVLGIRWEDVDFERAALSVRHTLQRFAGSYHLEDPKTAKSKRSLALTPPMVAVLRAHRARQAEERLRLGPAWQGEPWGLVFTDEAGGPMSESRLRKAFAAHVRAANLPPQRFHDLRHAAATFMLLQGVPLRVAMEVLGHSQIHVTANTYSHVMPELKRDAADLVSGLLFGP